MRRLRLAAVLTGAVPNFNDAAEAKGAAAAQAEKTRRSVVAGDVRLPEEV